MTAAVPDLPTVESVIVAETNAFRRENKLGEVTPNPVLAAAAKAYADYLARTEKFSHTADGRQPAERVRSAGYAFCSVAENLALNRDSRGFEATALARQAVEGWKNSPGHRQNMLTPHVTEIGVGVARGPKETYLSVQLFARPEALKYQFRIENLSEATLAVKIGGKPETVRPRVTVRLTQCLPTTVTVEAAKIDGTERRLDTRYEPVDGDRLTVTGTTAQSIKIERGR
jgi:hypothetical protein